MKFALNARDLFNAVAVVRKACANKTTNYILECIKVSAYNDKLTLAATDGEISITETMNAEVMEEGDVCLHGKTFADFLSRLKESDLSLSTCEKGIEIKYGNNLSYIQALPVDEFPKINLDINDNSFTITQKAFRSLVAGTCFSCATDDSRPILKGCLIETEGAAVTFTALDGYRLAVGKEELIESDGEIRIICPARSLSEISRMLTGEDEDKVTFYTSNGALMISIDGIIFTSRLFKGDFINRNAIMPKEFSVNIRVRKNLIEETVSRAAAFMQGDGSKTVLINMDIRGEALKITSESDMGGIDEMIEANIEGKDLYIAMNGKFLSDALKAIGEDEVDIQLNSPTSPFICTGKEKKDYLYLILPVRTTA